MNTQTNSTAADPTQKGDVYITWTKLDGTQTTGEKDQIMKAYFIAGRKGSLAATATPKEGPTFTGKQGTISEEALARGNEQVDYLRTIGFTPQTTVVPAGTRVISAGVENFLRSHQEWEDLPTPEEALTDIRDAVSGERRADTTATVGSLKMTVDDKRLLLTRGGGRLALERHGLKRLATATRGLLSSGGNLLPPWEHLKHLTADEVAYEWNSKIGRTDESNLPEVNLRTRILPGSNPRSVYAVVSPRYGVYDIDEAAADILQALTDTEMRVDAMYDQSQARLSVGAWYHANRDIKDLSAGDTFKAGVRLRSADDGTGSIQTWAEYLRNLCINLLILDSGRVPLYKRVHKGSMLNVGDGIKAAAEKSIEMWEPFAKEWGLLSRTRADAVLPGDSVHSRITALVDRDKGLRDAAAGIRRDVLVEMMIAGMKMEAADTSDATLADIVNAVTRVHTEKVPVPVVARMEQEAGRLMTRLVTRAEA